MGLRLIITNTGGHLLNLTPRLGPNNYLYHALTSIDHLCLYVVIYYYD